MLGTEPLSSPSDPSSKILLPTRISSFASKVESLSSEPALSLRVNGLVNPVRFVPSEARLSSCEPRIMLPLLDSCVLLASLRTSIWSALVLRALIVLLCRLFIEGRLPKLVVMDAELGLGNW